MRTLKRLSPAETDRWRVQPLTYPEVGATTRPYASYPEGYQHMQFHEPIGRGRAHLAAAGAKLMSWQMHRESGLAVASSSATAESDAVVVLRLGVSVLALQIPCRVVYIVDELDRRGFGYGTLEGHPVSGEEAFLVHLTADNQVMFTVSAFSRPATALARLGGPVTGLIQRRQLRRYAASLASR